MIRIGNAPCSWGVLEFDLEGEARRLHPGAERDGGDRLRGDRARRLGLHADRSRPAGCGTDTARPDHARRLCPRGAQGPGRHAPGVEAALKVARLLRATADRTTGYLPYLVLADNNGSDPVRTANAGRVTPEMGLSDAEWQVFAAGAERVARAVCAETGLAHRVPPSLRRAMSRRPPRSRDCSA